jgi:hypothetical protein
MAEADSARVVQFSDTHLSRRQGVPESVLKLLDREFAHAMLTAAPCPVVAIPGNHDIGFYGEDDERPRRITAFTAAVFIHQPQSDEPNDGWETPSWARDAFDRSIAGGDVRLIATGHRHRSIRRDRYVWAPSTTIIGEAHPDGTDPTLGAVDYTFWRGGGVDVQFLRP